jgi:shikimate kinase
MKRILLTGISGTGKSTVIEELAARGYEAVDTDEGGLSEIVSVPEDELTGLGPGQDWVWNEERVQEVLDRAGGELFFLSGCSPNQGQFYPQFDHVVLLTAPPEVIVERLASRTTNPFGKRPDEVTRVLQLQETIEPLLRRGADHVIDTRAPLEVVVDQLIDLARA